MKKLEVTVVGDLLKTSERFAALEHKVLDLTEKLDKVDGDLKGFLDICLEQQFECEPPGCDFKGDAETVDAHELECSKRSKTSGSAASTGAA